VAEDQYDVVVIGSGPGGYVAAIRASQLGLSTAIVERDERLGGTCLLRGCIPTKALLESAHLYEKMQKSKNFGIVTDGVEVDFDQVQKYRGKMVTANSKGVDFLMKKNEIDVHHGHGRIKAKGEVSVEGEDGNETVLKAKNIILATGSRCKDLPFIEMDHERTVNSDDILEIEEVPESLVVVGAGAVGSEFASIYRAFGAEVTLIEYLDHLLPIEDRDISKQLEQAFKKRGIDVLTGTAVKEVDLVDGGVKVHYEPADGGDRETIEAEMLLVAAGRAPVTEDIGADTVDLEVDENGFVGVDEYCRTNVDGIYALGDIINTPWLAHIASHEGVLIAEHIAGEDAHPINYDHTPNCTYCDPEVASAGLTEREAEKRGYTVKTGTFPFSASGKARIMGEPTGMVKFVAAEEYDELLGVHIIGPKATELISEITLGLQLETTVEEVVHAIHPHPTLAEAIGEAASATLNGAPLNS
jgi:dihydrolipoamide dehydrogenase